MTVSDASSRPRWRIYAKPCCRQLRNTSGLPVTRSDAGCYDQEMSGLGKHHATIVLERCYDATPGRVFAEFANPLVRAQWSAPSGDELVYEEAAFKVGGRDVFRCGPKGDLKYRGETIYHFISP